MRPSKSNCKGISGGVCNMLQARAMAITGLAQHAPKTSKTGGGSANPTVAMQ